MNVVHLEVTHADGRQESAVVDAERVLIGSGAHCDLRLPAEFVAHEHAAIEVLGETMRLEALAFEPPVKLDGHEVRRVALAPGSALSIGGVQVRVTTSAVVANAGRVRAARDTGGNLLFRVVGLGAMAALGAAVVLSKPPALGAAPSAAPPLFAAREAECDVAVPAQAASLAVDKRVVADGKRERHPFYVAEGVEAVNLYAQSAACFRAAGEAALADELGAAARQLRRDVEHDARVRRLRLERALAADDKDVGAREVVALRALYLGKGGAYVDWLNGVARRLEVDKETP